MNLNDAWDEALKKIPKEHRPNNPNDPYFVPKIIGIIWSIIAVAHEKGLDDISFIDNNQQIISIPLQKSTKEKTAKDKTKPVKAKVETNGKEKKTKEPTTESKE